MTLEQVVATVYATLRSLLVAEPQGYMALAAMVVVFFFGLIDLWRVRRRIVIERAQATEHDRAVWALRQGLHAASEASSGDEGNGGRKTFPTEPAEGIEPAETGESGDERAHLANPSTALPAEPSAHAAAGSRSTADQVAVESWSVFERYLEEHRRDLHANDVLQMVSAQRRLAAPDVAAVLALVRSFDPAALERQRRTPNVLLLIGLAGTVLGLAATVGRIDVSSLVVGLEQGTSTGLTSFDAVLRELPTAFVATIWGILSALLFSHLVGRADAQATHFVRSLERTTSEGWIPSLWPESVAVQYEDLNRSMRASNAVIERTRTLMQSMTEDFRSTLQQTSSAMGGHVTELAAVSADTRAAFRDLAGQVTQSVDSLDRASTQVTDAMKRLEAFHGELQDAYARMNHLFREAQRDGKQHVEAALGATRHQQQQFADVSDRTLVGLGAAADRMRDVAELIKRQEASIEALRDSMLVALEEGFGRSGASFRHTLETSTQGLAAAAVTMAEPVAGLRSLVHESLAGDAGGKTVEQLTAVVAMLAEAVVKLEQVTEGLRDSVERLDERQVPRLEEYVGSEELGGDAADGSSAAGEQEDGAAFGDVGPASADPEEPGFRATDDGAAWQVAEGRTAS